MTQSSAGHPETPAAPSADPHGSPKRDAAGLSGDDERESRERMAESGEPDRDALGNADGAS